MIVKNLKVSIDNNILISDITFNITQNDKIGLVGKNGVGKSTFLKTLVGLLKPAFGQIQLENQSIKLLKQEISKEDYDLSILEYIKKETKIDVLEEKLKQLENSLNESNMEEYGEILEQFLNLDGYSLEENLNYILSGLCFSEPLDKKVGLLSGGEKIKVLLASLLLSHPDILLLDEPTNNLDIKAIAFLEDFLKNTNAKMIIVSHDEEFLNNLTNKIFEIEDGKLTIYNLSYDDYLREKDILYEHQLKEYESITQKRKELKEKIKETKTWTEKGTNNKNKKDNDKLASNFAKERTKKTAGNVSKLQRVLDKTEVPDFEKKEEINFNLAYFTDKGNKDIVLKNLICGYSTFKTSKINLEIPFGKRVIISGKNGSGKTTLIQTIIGNIPAIEGEILIGSKVNFGYLSQNTFDLNNNLSIHEYLTEGIDDIDNGLLFTMLDKLNISYDDKDKLYNNLSPGERARVNIVKLALKKINILLLDEVTNHLDMEAIKIISGIIENFEGTIISISHNRRFNQLLNADYIYNIETNTIEYTNNDTKKK